LQGDKRSAGRIKDNSVEGSARLRKGEGRWGARGPQTEERLERPPEEKEKKLEKKERGEKR